MCIPTRVGECRSLDIYSDSCEAPTRSTTQYPRTMIRTILVATTTASALVFTAVPALAEPPDGKGTNTTETRSTGAPSNPNGFGSVVSQRAVDDHDIGEHASSQTEPRLGVGNVAAGDQAMFDLTGLVDTGTRPGDHSAPIGALTGYPATNRPGTHE